MTVLAYSPVLPSVELFGAYEGIASATAINETVSITFTPTEGTLFVVPYEIDTISQLQLEVGPTPSSYIPTPASGGTATRGAETLTVAAADLPWPTPKVIGPELVTNGDFATGDLSNWSVFGTDGTHSVTYSSGGARYQSDTTSPILSLSQNNVMTVGKVYQVTVETTAYTSGSLKTDSLSGTKIVSTGLGTITFVGVASSTTLAIVRNSTNVDITIDNISVREIDPLSVSIQMDGRMTYADTAGVVEGVYMRWYASATNYIKPQIAAAGASTGQITFGQTGNGVNDSVSSSGSVYSPGINVPYNIASRHGSTFINGAVDGTALTADNTPVVLPDLSATDLDLAYAYNGTIRTFRMWAKDLTDTGIEEASGGEPSSYLIWDASADTYISKVYN